MREEGRMVNLQTTELDLHAFIDGRLADGRRREVAAYLDAHPDAAERVDAYARQRTDSTHVLAAVHDLHLLELVAETLRAALDDLAAIVPDRLRTIARPGWFEPP